MISERSVRTSCNASHSDPQAGRCSSEKRSCIRTRFGNNAHRRERLANYLSSKVEIDYMEKAPEQQWYVVYVKPNREEAAQFHLQRKGFDTFLPRLRLSSSRRDRRQIVPLFPNYLFARLRVPDDYNMVRWAPGVNHLVGCEGRPTPLDSAVVDFLRQRATPDGILPERIHFSTGSGVRIVAGPFEGLVGVIENPPDARGRVKVLMQLLGRQVRVEIPVDVMDGGYKGRVQVHPGL